MPDTEIYDVVIVGSGPAGIQATINLQGYGLKIALLDDSSTLGGHIYKEVQKNSTKTDFFEQDYLKGFDLIKQINLNKISYINNSYVWNINPKLEIYYSQQGTSYKIKAKKILIATGSLERPFPVKGWTLPGVIGTTAAQILLKESLIVKDDAVFIGSGALFYYVISQYLDSGAKIKAVIDTTPLNNYFKAAKHLPKALLKFGFFIKALGFFAKFRKHKLKVYHFVDELMFEGDDELKTVVFKKGSKQVKIDTDIAFIHNGLAPNINLQLQVGCDYEYSKATRTVNIKTDEFMQSSVDNIFVVGDGKSIRGVDVAIVEAKIAANKILNDFNKIQKVTTYQKQLKSHMQIRDFLNTLYLPHKNFLSPSDDDVIICRCEEVTLKQIKNGLERNCKETNSIKSFTRCGMGSCQSRFCGLTLLEVISKHTNTPIEELKYLKIRSPIKPIGIEEMGSLVEYE
ncbi:FAD-dependent oxidoreductase [Candidatus Marithrix sp. Canyon 246]|uniref:FAD-dependent oxidoreductase n=1 Tax=Candidatus Marithrix sp. Canyon 246 TaxID=1827136 RepID=UPI000849F5D3|nr:FAD-dependent oxidoreductase [Candidatus Marithrix sp. Canyon 246]